MQLIESILSTNLGPRLIKDVRDSQKARGLLASGKSSDSLYFTVERKGSIIVFELLGSAYWYQQQNGRGPNVKAGKPWPGFVDIIRNWIRVKGLGIPLKAAYPIAAKIMREGTKVPNPFNRGGVLSEPLNLDRVKGLFVPEMAAQLVRYVESKMFNKNAN